MVMEAKPSPLVVGREFVRQYYTLLHNSPDHLHRFYNQQSSFTHSSFDDPNKDDGLVIGQKNIHDKIQQMNFRDCHAKISHVDAQATLGDGVVVQVFGELSNDGHQMRRFTQTFVLACQSPKKYYVHNDIFRYHDVYNDDEEQREEHEGTETSGQTPTNNLNTTDGTAAPIIVQPNVFYTASTGNVIAVTNNPQPPQLVYSHVPVQASPGSVPPQVNGVIHEEMLKNMATQTTQAPQIIPAPPQVIAMSIAPAPTALPIPVEPVAVVAAVVQPTAAVTVPMVIPEVAQSPPSNAMIVNENSLQFDANQSNGEDSETMDNSKEIDVNSSDEAVKTTPSPVPSATSASATSAPPAANWANLVKAGPQSVSGFAPQIDIPATQPQSFVAITQQQQQQAQQQKQAESYGNNEQRRGPPTTQRNDQHRERRVSNNNNEGSCQLFLGNLPTSATEEELKLLFNEFGKIVDLRIHTKQAQKGGNSRPVPNYGFITFEDPASAIKLQEFGPIFYPVLRDRTGQKLNVENKIRKNADGNQSGGMNRSSNNSGGQNMDRGRNNNSSGSGMNRNGSGGRSDRRDDRGGNRSFNNRDRDRMGPRTNGNAGGGGGGGTFSGSRR